MGKVAEPMCASLRKVLVSHFQFVCWILIIYPLPQELLGIECVLDSGVRVWCPRAPPGCECLIFVLLMRRVTQAQKYVFPQLHAGFSLVRLFLTVCLLRATSAARRRGMTPLLVM